MDHDLDAFQIFNTLNKDQYTNLGFLCLTDRYLRLKSKFPPGKLYATDVVFYLDIDSSEIIKCVAYHEHSGKDSKATIT